tara:strand:- start:467 stop:853 length:387 start_codon:yes stop_codon:yes gene_type:complete
MEILHEDNHKVVVCSSFGKKCMFDVMNSEIPRALFVINERECFLLHFYVPFHLRGNGIGKQMLLKIAHECFENGCRRIDLDDMSDRQRQKKNIYVQTGFKYRNTSGPEMYTSPRYLIKTLKIKYNLYI